MRIERENNLKHQIWTQFARQIHNQIYIQMSYNISNEIWMQVSIQLANQIQEQNWSPIWSQMRKYIQ
jgi:hypothetical protein